MPREAAFRTWKQCCIVSCPRRRLDSSRSSSLVGCWLSVRDLPSVVRVRACRWAQRVAAGAGAGLATAFNAPVAGAIFVLEELVRKFELRIAIAALGASAIAISVSHMVLGNAPDFHVEALAYAGVETGPLHFLFGAVAGGAAVLYNRTLLGAISIANLLAQGRVELRAALIGASVGVLAWLAPDLVGGGESITQRTLVGSESLAVLSFVFLLRFFLGAVFTRRQRQGGYLRRCSS